MRFGISNDIFEDFPTYMVGLVVAKNLDNYSVNEKIVELLRGTETQIRRELQGDIKKLDAVAVWRGVFQKLDLNPNKFRSSIEALLSRLIKGDILPSINSIVDLVNIASIANMVPAGAHDISSYAGDILVRYSRDDEEFKPIGEERIEKVEAGEVIYGDDLGVRTRRWVWRQNDRCKVTQQTKDVMIPVDGFIGVTDGAVLSAVNQISEMLREFMGITCDTYLLDARNSMVDIGGAAGPARPARDAIWEVLNRGIVDVIPRDELEARMRAGERLRVKFGIDPTGSKIHIGRAVPLRKLKQFQDLGHQIVLVIGDFTAQIGDASDKNSARQMLTADEVRNNMKTYVEQMSLILDMSKVEINWNSKWLDQMGFKDVIGLAANFTVAQMLERENFSERYSTNKPIGLHEFMYPLMQGYDSVALKADVEIGGTDQLFNLMAGRVLQKSFGQRPQAVMTMELIYGLDGRKMSTSWGNTISIVDSPQDQFGKLMSVGDELIISYLISCTEMPVDEIDQIADGLKNGSVHPMDAKKRLAREIVKLYHGPEAAHEAETHFQRTVQQKELPQDIPSYVVNTESSIVDLLVNSGVVPSRSEARRLVEQGGVSLGDIKIKDPRAIVGKEMLVVSKEDRVILKAGKRRFIELVWKGGFDEADV